MKRTCVILLVGLVWGCSGGNKPRAVLDEEQFERIYIELLDSAQHIRAAAVDSVAHPVAVRILERHGTTVEQFQATVAYYNRDTQLWKEFFQRVIQKLEERQAQRNNQQ